MLTFPFRLLSTIAFVLFCSSRFVRRAVAGVAVSAVIVAAQHQELFHAEAGEAQFATTMKALMSFISG